jgi:hypothetical protein
MRWSNPEVFWEIENLRDTNAISRGYATKIAGYEKLVLVTCPKINLNKKSLLQIQRGT